MGAPRAIALCQCFSGALEFQSGHWSDAEAALRESIRLYREIGAASGEALAWQRLGVLQTAQGKLDEAIDSLNEGLAAAEFAVMRAHCMVRLYVSMTRNRLQAGNLGSAERNLSLGLAMGERHGNCATCNALLLPSAVSVRVLQGKLSEAETFCQKLDEAAQEYGSKIWIAMARQSRGELASARNDIEGALTYYAEALQAYQAAGHNYEAARCLTAIADLCSARNSPGDQDTAVELRSQARQVYQSLGAADLVHSY